MKITRLGWAGLELEASSGETAVIDVLQEYGAMAQYMGEPHTALPAPTKPGAAVLALVTHLHQDHTDPVAIAGALAPGGVLLRPAPDEGAFLEVAGQQAAEELLAEHAIPQRHMAAWESVEVGPFRATAVPAVDGFGDPQVSWVVEADGVRIYHAGDTLYHGSWWRARMRTGDIDYAFLPINGPLVSLPHRQPGSPRGAVMSPAEAASAAYVLGAREAFPIHYDTINNPPIYTQLEDPAPQFLREAAALGVAARVVEPGAVVVDHAIAPA